MLGDVNKLFVVKRLLTTPRNVLPLHLNQTFPSFIWIFTEGESDGIESRLPFKIFTTLVFFFEKSKSCQNAPLCSSGVHLKVSLIHLPSNFNSGLFNPFLDLFFCHIGYIIFLYPSIAFLNFSIEDLLRSSCDTSWKTKTVVW